MQRYESVIKEGGYYKSPYDPSGRAQYYSNVNDIIKDYNKGIIDERGVKDIAEHFGWEDKVYQIIRGTK